MDENYDIVRGGPIINYYESIDSPSISMTVTFIDIDHLIIPNEFILIGLLILSIGLPLNFLPIEWIEGVYGALVFAGFLFFIGIIGQFILKKE